MERSPATSREQLIYDWNGVGAPPPPGHARVNDETLRDGLQSPSANDPAIADKLALLHTMERLGIDSVDLGLPGAGGRQVEDCVALAQEIARGQLRIKPNCAARTHPADIDAVARVSERSGMAIEACCFLGSSPVRRFAEGWTVTDLLRRVEASMRHCVQRGLPATFVTEDTTRCDPGTLTLLYRCAVDHGATAVVVADTVGHATPFGVTAVVRHVREVVGPGVRVDFHGHRDRGMDLANSFAAWLAGADQVHGTALGLGERVGNTPMELLLINQSLAGWIDRDLSALSDYCAGVSRATDVPIPANYPVFGADAFRTATGVHAAAIVKAMNRNDSWLADVVYSGVPASAFGARQRVDVGPMSGKWNVSHWLQEHGIEVTDERVRRVLDAAKQSHKVLTEEELRHLAS